MNKHLSVHNMFMLVFLLAFLIVVFSSCVTQNVYPPTDNNPQNLPVFLTAIEVFPDIMDLEINESLSISSVTAYYSDSSTKSISPDNCSYDSYNPSCATVNSSGLITGLSTGTAFVLVTYTEGVISKFDTITVNVTSSTITPDILSYIEAFPSIMNLNMGETQTINSVTAYYTDSSSKNINLSECIYISSNPDCAIISNDGTITAISDGSSTITISYTENSITKIDTIEVTVGTVSQNEVVYRALCVGVGDYIQGSDNDLSAPPYDVDRIRQVL